MIKDIYKKGRRKEYAICSNLRHNGYDIVQRTAGSHSNIDIIAINSKDKEILLIQSKRVLNESMNEVNQQLKEQLEKKFEYLNGNYKCSFVVL